MANITLTFSNPVQDSVQIGDIAYFSSTSTVGNFNTAGTINKIGAITAVTDLSISCDIEPFAVRPSANDFILFSKDNQANMASIAGYYAEVDMQNNDTAAAEIFTVSSEVVESSK
tara:strand:+ start:414 stop:758 length:345 start_codon:yes stop_codon:yes gene_type:complete